MMKFRGIIPIMKPIEFGIFSFCISGTAEPGELGVLALNNFQKIDFSSSENNAYAMKYHHLFHQIGSTLITEGLYVPR